MLDKYKDRFAVISFIQTLYVYPDVQLANLFPRICSCQTESALVFLKQMFKWVSKQGNDKLLARGSRPAVFILRFEAGKKGKVSLSRTADFILFHPGSDSPVLPFTDLWRTPRQTSRLRKCHIPALTARTSWLDKSGREQTHHAQLTPVTLLRQSRAAHECNPRPEPFKNWCNLALFY